MDQRREFCLLASLEGANVSALCAGFGISRQTGYVWLRRYRAGEELVERSRRPHASPRRSSPALEGRILSLRDAHPAWGARKLARLLEREGKEAAAASTVHAVLARHGRIAADGCRPQAYGRFERASPNELWQMDFKGRVRLACGRWCHTLTAIDDHSRYAVMLEACADEQTATVRERLERALCRHGLPQAIYLDNGSPWGGGVPGLWTPLRVWLLKLGVRTIPARPRHPQGRGKNERFHRSLKDEVFDLAILNGLEQAQAALDAWRADYNHVRPHEGIDLAVPASRYRPSPRPFPKRLPEPHYDSGETVRRVGTTKAYIRFQGRLWKVPKAFRGETIAIRPHKRDGLFAVCFGATRIATIDLKAKPGTSPDCQGCP
jgi:transposase InsO family protein